MTVTGSTSADVATTSYVPPYKYVTSYPATAQVTGTVTSTPVNPVVTGVQGTSAADYATAYLNAHKMSWPSYRYAYLLWMVLGLFAGIYALSHHLRLSGGSIGAAYAKWGMRRRPWGRKHHGTRGRALPSNSVLVAITVIIVVSCVLSILGSDYISPSSSTLDFTTSFRKRYIGYTINKAFWTSGSRFGFMAFALMPLVILFALKAPPIAVLSLRPLTHLYADKLGFFHRAIGWLIWIFTTVHVALWTVQLFEDKRNGSPVWISIWASYRFIFGCVAYGAMTALMVFSLRPVRKNRYEFFYIAHVVLVFLTIVCSAIHHPVLWFWMAGSLALWAAERLYRFIRMAKINGRSGKSRTVDAGLVAGRPYHDATTDYGMRDIKRSEPYDPPYTDKTLPRPPTEYGEDFGQQRSDIAYYDEGSLQPIGSYDNRTRPYTPATANDMPSHQRGRSSVATVPQAIIPIPIPVGYAQAQLLPSRTVRLTIHVSRPFKWSPGQSVLLYLPDLSRFQSHPFTIINNDPHEIVLLIKARKGLTRRLFNLVRQRSHASVGITGSTPDKRLSLASMRPGQGGLQAPPIFVRALIDGPMGSAGRVSWFDYPSVLIICGGSGVSFGAAVCDYVCAAMKQRCAGRTQRLRFCWVVREYAEIAWVAGQLRRCQDMVTAQQLQIDIFVTNVPKVRDEFAPPHPTFARGEHQRRGSTDSVASEMSVSSPIDTDETVDNHLISSYADVIDLTNYEDEEDVNDPVENQLSDRLQQQGKVRRARSRKAARRQSRGMIKSSSRGVISSPSYPPRRSSGYEETDYASAQEAYTESRYKHSAQSSATYAPLSTPHTQTSVDEGFPETRYSHPAQNSMYAPVSAPMLGSSSYDRRQSYRSVADSMYGQYDPFTSGGPRMGPSPSPSLFFDDNQSIAGDSMRDIMSRTSRTQSMVLLEDGGNDPTGDAALWVDESDYAAMNVMSELARVGKPKLSAVLEEELEVAQGSMIVATCGPTTLNTVVRNLVSKHISPSRIRYGDKRGHVAIYSEDYEG